MVKMQNKNIFKSLFIIGLLMIIVGGFSLFYYIYIYQFTQNNLSIIISTIIMSFGMFIFIIGFINFNNGEKQWQK